MNDEPEISHRRSNLPGNYTTGDRYAAHRVVTIGGGTGTFSLLSHLKKYQFNISAIVTMSDSGGSSRRLMDEFQRQLPLGDLRMSLVALARNGALWGACDFWKARCRENLQGGFGEGWMEKG